MEVDAAPGGARTLDNGLAVLGALARASGGRTVAELAREVGLDRTVVHRLVASLAYRRLAARRPDGRYEVGAGVLDLAAAVRDDLQSAAAAVLPVLAERVGATSHVSVFDGDDVVSVAVAEPRGTAMHVAYRVGTRHRLDQGAAGLAILLAGPSRPAERRELRTARRNGYAVTRGEIEAGAWGLATPVRRAAAPVTASVGVVALRPMLVATVAPAVLEAAAMLARLSP